MQACRCTNMKTVVRYACEICGDEFNTEAEALECESKGLPEPMLFLPWGVKIPAFGENGVEWATLRDVAVSSSCGARHVWVVRVTPFIHVSHNIDRESGFIGACAFDPRCGIDAFRYCAKPEDVAVWRKAMADYGFKESEANEWVRARIREDEAPLAYGVVIT